MDDRESLSGNRFIRGRKQPTPLERLLGRAMVIAAKLVAVGLVPVSVYVLTSPRKILGKYEVCGGVFLIYLFPWVVAFLWQVYRLLEWVWWSATTPEPDPLADHFSGLPCEGLEGSEGGLGG